MRSIANGGLIPCPGFSPKNFTHVCNLGIIRFVCQRQIRVGKPGRFGATEPRPKNAVFFAHMASAMAGRAGSRKARRFPNRRSSYPHGSVSTLGSVGAENETTFFDSESIMTDQSPSAPPAPTLSSFQELVDDLYIVANLIDDCKWVANALYRAASFSDIRTPDEVHKLNKRMKEVSKNLFTVIWNASNEMLRIAEGFEKEGKAGL